MCYICCVVCFGDLERLGLWKCCNTFFLSSLKDHPTMLLCVYIHNNHCNEFICIHLLISITIFARNKFNDLWQYANIAVRHVRCMEGIHMHVCVWVYDMLLYPLTLCLHYGYFTIAAIKIGFLLQFQLISHATCSQLFNIV